MCLNKAKFDSERTLSYSIGLPSLLKFVTVEHTADSTSIKKRELVVNRVW